MAYFLKFPVLALSHGAGFLVLSLCSPTYALIWPSCWNIVFFLFLDCNYLAVIETCTRRVLNALANSAFAADRSAR